MKTLAAVLIEINRPLKLEQLIVPKLKSGQILVKVAYSGVCHSQLNEIHGFKGKDIFLPHTLGHEGSGVVVDIGPNVKKIKPGDHVVLTWIKGHGIDAPSAIYKRKDGIIVNSGSISTFMEYTVVAENRVVAIKKEMPLKEAALLGCAIPTGAGIIMNTAKVRPGNSVAVFGVGGIGLSALMASQLMNATTIIGIDIFDHKLEIAREIGATHIVNARIQDPLKAIMEITENHGVDYAIESVGQREAMETAFKSVRDCGGLCILAGNLPIGQNIGLDPFDLIKGKHIVGTWGGETCPDDDIPRYASLYLSGKLDLKKIISHIYELKDINQSFTTLEEGKSNRVLIEMSKKQS